ncbi:hypothetical protein NAEGRDRAFT_78154 [Naegleria gruberi]|uniref:RPA-interacting protein N-terminal domain-containing protein n=1 Tax=Naegleria gruberi TaxID=5762 RepID=D2V1M5_NAEGR|nr:uncharacterized protein NAEGRDRAFT_78154 [Naegleria gruberi]EFC49338.1 hypothetical protein NAEGRDRAFT_78154 [Naegleria gruberi]|eukprot:XP_002682082.1 hypothetical protein NAEGRDRAFT_78154 [Naegleria gruberi strain NEG-M]
MFNYQDNGNHHLSREASIKVKKTEYKNIIKKRAIENVKEKRRQLQNMIRDPFSNSNDENLALHDEYIQACKTEMERIFAEEKGSMSDDEYFDLLVQIGNEIENEWREEEENHLKQFEEEEALEAEDLQQLIDYYEKSVYLCPLCKKNHLLETKHSLFCKCGLRVPTSVCVFLNLNF